MIAMPRTKSSSTDLPRIIDCALPNSFMPVPLRRRLLVLIVSRHAESHCLARASSDLAHSMHAGMRRQALFARYSDHVARSAALPYAKLLPLSDSLAARAEPSDQTLLAHRLTPPEPRRITPVPDFTPG